ncbi:hypothetical protein [Salinithrix halophila]|uniref:YqfQ-like protein n=1 Tax=Salinithrix halophila TaxID=1485204 RepID=A0ABV8JHB6_9BACL
MNSRAKNRRASVKRSPAPGSKSRAAPRTKPSVKPAPNKAEETNPFNMAQLISSFFTLRSTVQQLSESLQRMEKIMSNAYQIFEMASTFVGRGQGRRMPRRRPPLRLIKPNREEEDFPRLDLPDGPPGPPGASGPLSKIMENIDMNQLFKLLQSPMVQQMLNSMMASKTSDSERKQKQG